MEDGGLQTRGVDRGGVCAGFREYWEEEGSFMESAGSSPQVGWEGVPVSEDVHTRAQTEKKATKLGFFKIDRKPFSRTPNGTSPNSEKLTFWDF